MDDCKHIIKSVYMLLMIKMMNQHKRHIKWTLQPGQRGNPVTLLAISNFKLGMFVC